MKVIAPCLVTIGSVSPRTVRALTANDVTRSPHCQIAQPLLLQQSPPCAQRLGRHQARIEDSRSVEGRIAEANLLARFLSAIQIVQDEITDGPRVRQVRIAIEYFCGFTQRARRKGRRHNSRRSLRRKE